MNHDWVREFLHHFIEQNKSLGVCLNEIGANKELLRSHRHKILKNLNKFIPYFNFALTSAQRSIIRQDLVELDFKTTRKSLLAIEIDQVILERPGLRQHAHNLASIPGISPFSAVWILAGQAASGAAHDASPAPDTSSRWQRGCAGGFQRGHYVVRGTRRL